MPTSTSTISENNVDVLIIGAGPAGLMAANALARSGVKVRIIDQKPDKVVAGQADGIQPRTIEVFQSYGLAERLLKEGNQMHMVAFYNPSSTGGIELTDRVPDVTAPSARYPFEVTLHQGAIEAILLDSMDKFGLQVSRPTIPISLQLSGDESVRVVLLHLRDRNQDEIEIVNAKFVIGADGAHSWVRKTLGITMDGEQTNDIWGVVDLLAPNTDFPDIRNRCVIHSNNGSCMVIPREGDKVRLYIQLDEKSAFVSGDGRVAKGKTGPHQLLEVAQKSLHPYSIQTPDEFDWWTIYMIGQRVASKFSLQERVFIVGDACHTHSPKAGQGMNASMNDSHNLAWKLTHVLKGWADSALLRTYEFERRKYAQDLIDFDKKFAKLFSGKPRTEEFQDGVSHEEFLQIFQTFGGFTSGIGIQYAESVLTNPAQQNLASNLIIGERVPPQLFMRAADSRPVEIQDLLPSDARFKLLIFTGNASWPSQLEKVWKAAEELEPILTELAAGRIFEFFDIVSASSATKATVRYNDLPSLFRLHWSKALIDDTDVTGTQGGNGYKNYGIGTDGVVVVVRPDGYVGMITALDCLTHISTYFKSFLRANRCKY